MKQRISRRNALRVGAAATALPMVHIRTAGAAGKLTIGMLDHWVPKGNEIMLQQINAWADKNKVEVSTDFLTTMGAKLQLTAAAENMSKSGHDMLSFLQWDIHTYQDALQPIDDAMKVLIDRYGAYNDACKYLGTVGGKWLGMPNTALTLPAQARISTMRQLAGIDVQAMYPARPEKTTQADSWTWDTFLKAAEACHKGGMPFGVGVGSTPDSVNSTCQIFASFGAEMVDAKGNIKLKSPEMRQALEYCQKLVKFLPEDAASYDDASNNKILIAGKSALIFNPPSSWAVAKRDARPIAADCWHIPSPAGPKGRYVPYVAFFWGIWKFAKNASAAKDLMIHLASREQMEPRCTVVEGYDIPPQNSMLNFKVWAEVEPPVGTCFNYPIQPWHGSKPLVSGSPAPPSVAVQIFNRGTPSGMLAKLKAGQSIDQVIGWAQNELEGFVR